ncbi:MAG: hypothetical protein RH860_05675 [Cytophagales bacterium]
MDSTLVLVTWFFNEQKHFEYYGYYHNEPTIAKYGYGFLKLKKRYYSYWELENIWNVKYFPLSESNGCNSSHYTPLPPAILNETVE